MLLDEPSDGVEPSIVQLICTALRSFCRELGTTILFVEQNLDTILALSDRSYVTEKGCIVANIPPGDVNADTVQRSFALLPEFQTLGRFFYRQSLNSASPSLGSGHAAFTRT